MIRADNDPASLDAAMAWTEASGLTNVRQERGDLTDVVLDEPLDAPAGRIVLPPLDDPAAVVPRLARRVRPGGVVVLQDISCGRVRAVPRIPVMADRLRWMRMLSAHAARTPTSVSI